MIDIKIHVSNLWRGKVVRTKTIVLVSCALAIMKFWNGSIQGHMPCSFILYQVWAWHKVGGNRYFAKRGRHWYVQHERCNPYAVPASRYRCQRKLYSPSNSILSTLSLASILIIGVWSFFWHRERWLPRSTKSMYCALVIALNLIELVNAFIS
jgi:hypothetical protein